MKTSLAASPLVPLATAGVVALLIVGTLTSSSTATGTGGDSGGLPAPEAPPVIDPAAPVAGAPATVGDCNNKACTALFPGAGSTAEMFGQVVTTNVLYDDGAEVSVGNKTLVVSTTVPGNAGKAFKISVPARDATGVTITLTRR